MQKKRSIILVTLCVGLCIIIAMSINTLVLGAEYEDRYAEEIIEPIMFEDENGNTYEIMVPADQVEEWERQQREKEMEILGITIPSELDEDSMTLFSKSYAIATEAQKKQLSQIQESNEWGAMGDYTRAIMIVMGDLSADTPRLTLEQAQEICDDLEGRWFLSSDTFEENAVKLFNKFAGAPDFQGGSGVYRYVYYLNEEQTESITIMLGRIKYTDEVTGESKVLVSYG